MPQVILHHDGAYQLYSTVADGACYESALTLEQLRQVIEIDHGKAGLHALPERLERAHKKGTSDRRDASLADTLSCNRAGPNETKLSVEDFISRYLTLPSNA